jgi:phosphohistidine phosphatase
MEAARHIYLLRHAKSSWVDGDLDDHERPLSPRGEQTARQMATHLRLEAVEPDLVLCSTAERARQTLAALSLGREALYEDEIYGATAVGLLARLHRIPEPIGSAMLIGHNPGFQELAVSLAGKGDPVLVARVREKLPTCALVKLAFQGPWASLAESEATLEALVVPRDLEAEPQPTS